MTYKIEANCPECGYEVDDAAFVGEVGDGLENVRPTPGDLAICIKCAGCGIYEESDPETLRLRLTTIQEKVALSQDEHVRQVRDKIFEMTDIWLSR